MGWMSERENVTMPCCAESDGHAMKNLHNDASKTTFISPYPIPHLSPPLSLRNSPRSIPRVPLLLLTRHYVATLAIHARTGSAPPQKSGSRQPDATAQSPGQAPPYRRRHHRCLDQRRPTSAHRTVGPGEVAPGARPVRVRTLEVEAAEVAVAAAAVAASVVET